VIILLFGGVGVGAGQSMTDTTQFCREETRRVATPDTRGLAAVYCGSNPALERPLDIAHATARPVFYGAVPLAWGWGLLNHDDSAIGSAYRLTLAQGVTSGVVVGIKHAVGRPRPYVTRRLTAHPSYQRDAPGTDPFTSFPSGHAALSAALVTSWSLSYPQWYVIGPGSIWAGAVALSRLDLGVHYPSDVLVGVGIGVGIALLTHHFRDALTPSFIEGNAQNGIRAPPPVQIHIRF